MGAVLGLGLIVYASAHPVDWVWSPPEWNFVPPVMPTLSEPENTPVFAEPPPETGSSHMWILATLGILAGLVLLFFVVRLIIRAVSGLLAARIEIVPSEDALPTGALLNGVGLTHHEVVDVVEEALRRLDAAPTPTDAVIQAWLAFEEAASRHGMTRDPAQTPTEFTAEILDRSPVPPFDAVRLRTLYLRARFSEIPTSPTDVGGARHALEHIARSLEQT